MVDKKIRKGKNKYNSAIYQYYLLDPHSLTNLDSPDEDMEDYFYLKKGTWCSDMNLTPKKKKKGSIDKEKVRKSTKKVIFQK